MPHLTGAERLLAAVLALLLGAAAGVAQQGGLTGPAPVEVTAAAEAPAPAWSPLRLTAPPPPPPPPPPTTPPPTTQAAPPSPPPAPTRAARATRRPATTAAAPAPAAPPAEAPPPPAPAVDPGAYAGALLAAVNDERRARGLAPLAHDGCADRYADAQAARMAARGSMSHQALEPVLDECGTSRAAENVGQGDVSAQRMVAAWMASDGHRRNILDPALTAVGTGAARGADGRWYACQVFVAR